jgi:hypothetical protein
MAAHGEGGGGILGVVGLGASGTAGVQHGKLGGASHLSRRQELKEGKDPRWVGATGAGRPRWLLLSR